MIYSNRGRLIRRGFGIGAYVGANGSGKSAAMIYDTLPSLAEGRTVLSTVRLLDASSPRICDDPHCDHILVGGVPQRGDRVCMAAHECYVPWTDWGQLLDAEHCDVLADEITGVASGRSWSDLPAPILNMLCQLRRRDVVLRWTAPAWAMADSVLKRTTQAVTICSGYLPREVQDGTRQWRERRLFRWLTYDAQMFTEVENDPARRAKLSKLCFSLTWGPSSDMFSAYDTYDDVTSIGTVSDVGTCMRCGGTRRRPACHCADYKSRTAAERATDFEPRRVLVHV